MKRNSAAKTMPASVLTVETIRTSLRVSPHASQKKARRTYLRTSFNETHGMWRAYAIAVAFRSFIVRM